MWCSIVDEIDEKLTKNDGDKVKENKEEVTSVDSSVPIPKNVEEQGDTSTKDMHDNNSSIQSDLHKSAELKEVLSRGKQEWGRAKIMIVGEGRAGKTALANSIIGKPFSDTESTIGINQMSCNIQFASVGGAGDKWNAYDKPEKELEAAIAKMIIAKRKEEEEVKASGVVKSEVDSKTGTTTQQNVGSATMNKVPVPTAPAAVKIASKGETNNTVNESPVAVLVDGNIISSVENDDLDEILDEDPEESSNLISEDDVDGTLMVKCLADAIQTDSKFIISVFDFGGQSVFNVIHPFFLTRYGIYLLVFNMEWLLTENSRVREQCLSYLHFWVNSVVIHTYNAKTRETAHIVFVGELKCLLWLVLPICVGLFTPCTVHRYA